MNMILLFACFFLFNNNIYYTTHSGIEDELLFHGTTNKVALVAGGHRKKKHKYKSEKSRPLSVPFLGKGTDMATMLRLEKYERFGFLLGR